MTSKWIVYFLTLISFALVHSIRSAWSSLKSMLHDPPFSMSIQYLGIIDMTALFSLAITITLFGSQVQKYGSKRVLNLGMLTLAVLVIIMGICLLMQITSQFFYFLSYGLLIGVISAIGWPSCLSILSKKFTKKNNVALPLWNGTSQLGDFIALFISDFIIYGINGNGSITMIVIAIIMLLTVFLNKILLPNDRFQSKKSQTYQLNQQRPLQEVKQSNLEKQNQEQTSKKNLIKVEKNDKIQVSNQINQVIVNKLPVENQEDTSVNFMNVWCLPSVPCYVIVAALVKSVNTMLVAWLVLYLYQLQMKSQARIIAILWSSFVFFGGAIGGYFNPTYSKKIFILSLSIAAIMFIFLEHFHQRTGQIQIIISLIICALFYGGPYNLMSTAIPLVLSEKPQIKKRKNAKPAIIAVIDGISKLVNGIILLIVPWFGILNLHWIGCTLCLISAVILAFQQYKQIKQPQIQLKLSKRKKSQTEQLTCKVQQQQQQEK